MTQLSSAGVNWDLVEELAAALASNNIDPNEAAKASTYLTGHNLEQLFEWLIRTTQPGGAKVLGRSQQTVGYYQRLQQVCTQYLRGRDQDEATQALAWAVRLMRYVENKTAGAAPRTATIPARLSQNTVTAERSQPVEQELAQPDRSSKTDPVPDQASTPASISIPQMVVTPVEIHSEYEATVKKVDKTIDLDVPEIKGEKELKWIIPKEEAKQYIIEANQTIRVAVSEVNDVGERWVIKCTVKSDLPRKTTSQPNQTQSSKKTTLSAYERTLQHFQNQQNQEKSKGG
jgi:hypothetical protein